MLDLKIAGGQVLDGTGAPAMRADIGVTGDKTLYRKLLTYGISPDQLKPQD